MGISASRRRKSGTRGASLVEYLILLGIVALLAIAAWRKFHDSMGLAIAREAYQVRTLEGAETRIVASSGAPTQGGTSGAIRVTGPALGETAPAGPLAVVPPGVGTPAPGGGSVTLDWPSRMAAKVAPGSSADPRGGASGSWGPPFHGVSGSWDPTPEERADALVAGVLKIMCPKDKAFLQDLSGRGVTIVAYDRIYFEDPYYDGKGWTTKHFEAAGSTRGTAISMIAKTDEENAATIFHEGVHTGQPSAMPWRNKEYDAYTKGEQWALDHGQPPHDPAFRKKDKSGKEVVNSAAIRAFVDKEYPGVSAKSSGGAVEEIIGRTADGKTTVRRADGTEYQRAPKSGDSFPGPQTTVPNGGIHIDIGKLQCR